MRNVCLYIFFALIFSVSVGFAQTASTLSIQGVLRDATGAAVADGNYAMTFNIYSAVTGGSSLWTETQSAVAIQNGVYSVQLGSVTPFGSLAFNQQYWIGITTGGVEMSPRITLTAAPYAMGFKGTSNVFGSSGNVGIGTLNPSSPLTVTGMATTDHLTVNGTANIGTENVSTLNANTTTLGATTINGTTLINGNTKINGTISPTDIVTGGAISTGGATLVTNSISAKADLIAGGNVTAAGNVTATGDVTAGGKYAAVSNSRVKIVAGIGTTSAASGASTGGYTLSKAGDGSAAGCIKITFDVGYTVVSFNVNTAWNAGANGNNTDFRTMWWVQYYGSEPNAIVTRNRNVGGTFVDCEFMFTAILVKN